MHGWISLPLIWQELLLCLAPILGAAAGYFFRNHKHPVRIWVGLSYAYAFGVILVAFQYEQAIYPSALGYNFVPWFLLTIPVFLYALPAGGLPWLALRWVGNRLGSKEAGA